MAFDRTRPGPTEAVAARRPLLVEGMVHGSTAHGIGATLLEEFVYDEDGRLLATTFVDYLKPTALDVPALRVEALETPSPRTALGAKGVGEGARSPRSPPSRTRSTTHSRHSASHSRA